MRVCTRIYHWFYWLFLTTPVTLKSYCRFFLCHRLCHKTHHVRTWK